MKRWLRYHCDAIGFFSQNTHMHEGVKSSAALEIESLRHYISLLVNKIIARIKTGIFGSIHAQEHNELNWILTKFMGMKHGS